MDTNTESVLRDDSNIRYVIRVCFVAAMGGLLFGFDTAVISGAEQSFSYHLLIGYLNPLISYLDTKFQTNSLVLDP